MTHGKALGKALMGTLVCQVCGQCVRRVPFGYGPIYHFHSVVACMGKLH